MNEHPVFKALEGALDAIDEQSDELTDLRTRLEALEKWGREVVKGLPKDSIWRHDREFLQKIYEGARTLGLVEE